MKLSELLILRKDKTKEISRLQDKMKASLFFIGAEGMPDNIPEKQKQYAGLVLTLECLYKQLEELNQAIEKTNQGISSILVLIRVVDSGIAFYNTLRKDMLEKIERHTTYSGFGERTNQSIKQAFTLEQVELVLEQLEKDRRELDKKVQHYNWTTEVEV